MNQKYDVYTFRPTLVNIVQPLLACASLNKYVKYEIQILIVQLYTEHILITYYIHKNNDLKDIKIKHFIIVV